MSLPPSPKAMHSSMPKPKCAATAAIPFALSTPFGMTSMKTGDHRHESHPGRRGMISASCAVSTTGLIWKISSPDISEKPAQSCMAGRFSRFPMITLIFSSLLATYMFFCPMNMAENPIFSENFHIFSASSIGIVFFRSSLSPEKQCAPLVVT